MANDIQFGTAAPMQGLLSGVQQGMSAGMLIQQERRLQTQQKLQQEAAIREEQKAKATAGLELVKQSWVPEDYKLMLYNQNIRPFFQTTKTPLPELQQWPNFGDKAAKELQDVITKGEKAGLPPAEIETMAAMTLMKYAKEFQDMGKPVLESLRAQQASLDKRAEMRKAPSGYRWTATGDLEPIPGGPGKGSEADKMANAQNRVTGNLQQMKSLYQGLEKMGAIIDTSKNSAENVFRATASSKAGQAVGRIFGTEAQSIRNQINQIKPLLLQEIRQATQMGSKGLDSEKELEFYLQAATDPSKDIQTNLNAIKVLDKAYGLGILGDPSRPAAPGAAQGGGQKIGRFNVISVTK